MSAEEMFVAEPAGEGALGNRKAVAAIGAVLLLLLFACLLWWILSQRAEVPDVVGMKRDDAKAAIVKAGFAVGDIATQTALPGEAGTIVDQAPDGGRHALKGSEVALVLAEDLVVAGPGGPTYGEGGTPTGEADLFTLPTGTGAEAADVQYHVAPDNRPRVPDVLGMTEAAAKSALAAAGYKVTVKSGPVSTTAPVGRVYFEEPAPDSFEPRGTVVTIWVANSDSPAGYTLPTD